MSTSAEKADTEISIEDRIAAVKMQRRALLNAEADASSATALADALANEERAFRDESAIAAARKKHGAGKFAVVRSVGAKDFDVVVLKRAHAAAFKAFQDKDGFKLEDVEELVTPCVEYPSKDAFDRLHTHDAPMVLTRCAEAVAYLAGMRKTADLGKA